MPLPLPVPQRPAGTLPLPMSAMHPGKAHPAVRPVPPPVQGGLTAKLRTSPPRDDAKGTPLPSAAGSPAPRPQASNILPAPGRAQQLPAVMPANGVPMPRIPPQAAPPRPPATVTRPVRSEVVRTTSGEVSQPTAIPRPQPAKLPAKVPRTVHDPQHITTGCCLWRV